MLIFSKTGQSYRAMRFLPPRLFLVLSAQVLQDLNVVVTTLGLTVQNVGEDSDHTQLLLLAVCLDGVLRQDLLKIRELD